MGVDCLMRRKIRPSGAALFSGQPRQAKTSHEGTKSRKTAPDPPRRHLSRPLWDPPVVNAVNAVNQVNAVKNFPTRRFKCEKQEICGTVANEPAARLRREKTRG